MKARSHSALRERCATRRSPRVQQLHACLFVAWTRGDGRNRSRPRAVESGSVRHRALCERNIRNPCFRLWARSCSPRVQPLAARRAARRAASGWPRAVWTRLNPLTHTVNVEGWASECPDVKNYKWWLNPVWHRMLYTCSCTHPHGNSERQRVKWESVCTSSLLLNTDGKIGNSKYV